MGHFGRAPIGRAWFFVVFPALTLNYMGQGSLILDTPSAIDNPFFLPIPHWGRIPMVVLATVATVIASQAVISGAFSVTRQAIQLGFLPRLTSATPRLGRSARSTRRRSTGSCSPRSSPSCRLRLLDRARPPPTGSRSPARSPSTPCSSSSSPRLWRKPGWQVAIGALVFFTVRLRVPRRQPDQDRARRLVPALGRAHHLPVLSTWKRGSEKSPSTIRIEEEGSLRNFVRRGAAGDQPPPARVPGAAVYLNARRETTPLALRASGASTPTPCTRR